MDKLRSNDMPQHLLQMLAVLFIDAEKEKGQHQSDHQHCRRVVPDAAPCEDVEGYAYQRAAAEANELTAGEVKGDLCFYLGQVLRDWHKGHYLASLSFALAAGFSRCSGLNSASWARMEGLRCSDSISYFSFARSQKSRIASARRSV